MAWIAESCVHGGSLASFMSRLASAALLTAFALTAFDGIDAAQTENDAVPAPHGEIRFSGAILAPAGSHATADVRSVSSLPVGEVVRHGSADPSKRDPPRTVVSMPSRNPVVREVLITYD